MRNALILLAVVALVILGVGALNNGTAFEIDYVAGTMSQVSLFWVSLVIAAIVFVAGLAAAWFALAGAAGGRRKLEAELQSTYERLRETEREAGEARAAVAAAAASAAAEATPEIVEATVVAEREESTVVVAEAVTMVADEAETVVAGEGALDEPAEMAGEQTAVTMAAAAAEPAQVAETGDDERAGAAAGAAEGEPREASSAADVPSADDAPQGDAPPETAGDAKT